MEALEKVSVEADNLPLTKFLREDMEQAPLLAQ